MPSWFRKADPGDPGEVNGWIKIKSLFRKADYDEPGEVGGWVRIKSAWRYSNGIWLQVFQGSNTPYVDGANPPELYFVAQDGFTSTDSPFNGDKIYLTRGMWEEEPLKFRMRIQKSLPPYTDWEDFESTPCSPLPNCWTKTYTEYKDSDYTYQFPSAVSSRPSISKTNVRNKVKFRGQVTAQNSAGQYSFETPEIAARLNFTIANFEITDETETTVSFSWSYNNILPVDLITDLYTHKIQLYNSSGAPQIALPQFISLYDTTATVTLPSGLDPDDTYEWELEAIADDFYRDFTGYPYSSDGPTAEYAYIEWTPAIIVEDPEITFTSRTTSSFSVEWFSSNAEKYEVNIYDSVTGNSIFGYPKITEDLSASPFGLSQNKLYSVSVMGLAGATNQYESNEITESVRTLTEGIAAELGDPYDQSANGFKIFIINYSDIDDFDIQVDTTNGTASRSGDVITISNISQGSPACVTVTTSRIDEVNLTVQSYDIAVSEDVCETIGTWYCVFYANTNPVTCSTFESTYDASHPVNSFGITKCFQTPVCCGLTTYSEWSEWSQCDGPVGGEKTRTRTRTKTVSYENCTTDAPIIETETKLCWYCTESYGGQGANCIPCTKTIEESNLSGSGTGYSRACSTIDYPNCASTCVCDTTQENNCGTWSAWSECSGPSGAKTRTRTRTCPQGNPCSTTQTEPCWYCTESYGGAGTNCIGCNTSVQGSNISGNFSGVIVECDRTDYPVCKTPCTCDSTKESQCGSWTAGNCTGPQGSLFLSRTYTRTCPPGSPCATSRTEPCWYCTESYGGAGTNCIGCNTSIQDSDISFVGSGVSISCSRSGFPNCGTPCVCDSTKESQCGSWSYTNCAGNPPTRTRTRTCPAGSPCATSVTEQCWYCTQSVGGSGTNCTGCNYTTQSSNISFTGSGVSISCSQSGFPNCGTPCVCDTTQENNCGSWSNWSTCTGSPPTRTRTRTCPGGSPCATSETQQCWYCTESYGGAGTNCIGCNTSIQGSNISYVGSGISISCSQSGFPNCGTPCVCDSTQEGNCTAWSCTGCTGSPPTRTCTRTCPSGSPCATSETRSCWYCTQSVSDNCAGCTQTIESSNISSSGSGFSISCSQTAFPNCGTPCVQWWCKTTTQGGYCSLTGPFTSNQSASAGMFVTICTTGTSNPYTCVASPFFPFFPPFFPFFPPYFAPIETPFFPFFPPFFPFFPPYFKTSQKCIYEDSFIMTQRGYVKAKELSLFDKVYSIDPKDLSDGMVDNAVVGENVTIIEVDIVKIQPSIKNKLIKFNNLETLVSSSQPILVERNGRVTYKDAVEVVVGDSLIKVFENGRVERIIVNIINIINEDKIVYDIRTSKWPWFITKDFIAIS